MSNKLNTHFYDGKLGQNYKKLVEWDNKNLSNPINFENAMKEIQTIGKKELNKPGFILFMKIFNLITKDQHKKNNTDPTNKISIEDLLPRTWKFYQHVSSDDRYIFFEQFIDINKGTCPQGRAGPRLYQLYQLNITFAQEIKKFEKKIIEQIKIKANDKLKNKKDIEPDERISLLVKN